MRTLILLLLGIFVVGCTNNDQKLTESTPLKFFVIGDWGRASDDQKKLADAMDKLATAHAIDFVITVGDNFYPIGVSSATDPQFKTAFEDIYTGSLARIPWYITLGNHDYISNPQGEIDYSKINPRWKMPSYFYTVLNTMKDGGKVRIVILDTTPFSRDNNNDPSFWGKVKFDTTRQKIWMDSVLALKDASWTIAFGHHAIFSGGLHGPELGTVRNSLMPIFSKNNLLAYFAGHDHDLQHLKSPNSPTHQFISGAGSELRPTSKLDISQFAASVQGFMSIEVNKNAMKVFVINYQLDTLYKTQLNK